MKMGFEGLVYYGTAGSTASTQITNRDECTIDTDPEMAETTVAGAGSSVPMKSEAPVAVGWSMTLGMKNTGSDSVVEALRTAAAAGTPVAIRMKDHSSGKGYDGDCNVKDSSDRGMKGTQTSSFTFTPNNASREPQYYV